MFLQCCPGHHRPMTAVPSRARGETLPVSRTTPGAQCFPKAPQQKTPYQHLYFGISISGSLFRNLLIRNLYFGISISESPCTQSLFRDLYFGISLYVISISRFPYSKYHLPNLLAPNIFFWISLCVISLSKSLCVFEISSFGISFSQISFASGSPCA